MRIAAIPADGRDLVNEQAREERLHVGPGHGLDRV